MKNLTVKIFLSLPLLYTFTSLHSFHYGNVSMVCYVTLQTKVLSSVEMYWMSRKNPVETLMLRKSGCHLLNIYSDNIHNRCLIHETLYTRCNPCSKTIAINSGQIIQAMIFRQWYSSFVSRIFSFLLRIFVYLLNGWVIRKCGLIEYLYIYNHAPRPWPFTWHSKTLL